jgi:hypothetical protein
MTPPANLKEETVIYPIGSLRGYVLRATDGEIGTIHDFYFDDEGATSERSGREAICLDP